MKVKKANYLLVLLLSSVSIIVSKTGNILLNVEELYYQSLTVNLTTQQIERIFEVQKKIEWLYYIIVPIVILIRTMIISSIIYIGIMLFNYGKIRFNLVWNNILKAEFIFVLVSIFKIAWFSFFQTNYNLQDLQYFYPLSVLNIIGYKGLETWFIYPFQVLNLFELSYVIYLGFQIGKLTNTNTDYGLKIVGLSYVPSLLLWVTTVMFFTLNYS
ncbi:hypothetical protein Q1W71_15045 [Flavobacterium pectinovorum]|uniref:hypothetical protein n=1 Tax=Flavobacterium pectinovorum TaxID=29533 RepID=UPI00265F7E05|nr:hypothetical protein [Flavobacterium pectinovorum]WKL46270.1 hypothetical protein Q1W71_15045 [Flavobacterium pectinovorum]